MGTLTFDFQNSIGHSICRAAHLFERAMQEELEPTGITFRQCQVLAWLAIEGNVLSQVELAERMNIEPPTLVSALDRMERDGLVVREGCPDDRRKKLIQPLPKAAEVWTEIMACGERVRARAAHGMSAAEIAQLNGLLRRVAGNLSDKNDLGRQSPSC